MGVFLLLYLELLVIWGYGCFDWQSAIWELDERENAISENLGVERWFSFSEDFVVGIGAVLSGCSRFWGNFYSMIYLWDEGSTTWSGITLKFASRNIAFNGIVG